MEYLRPKTIEEALELLAEGIPLGGGTQLVSDRFDLTKVIDLQSLGLDQMREQDGIISIGAMTRLQSLLTGDVTLPQALRAACRFEAAWNIRNQATLGGLLIGADGRSPLLTVFSVLEPKFNLVPDDVIISLADLLKRRKSGKEPFILLEMSFKRPLCLAYDYVARAPMDTPIVSAAAAMHDAGEKKGITVSIGGYGEGPLFWTVDYNEDRREALLSEVAEKAKGYFQEAGDAFASAEYRAEVAGILVVRVVSEVMKAC